ncbi:MAG: hypothetical protein AB7E51_08515 [Pseudodesulfovibrio sp.]|uniref:hypothetical protein n=1 Tax=Pseudodesulfovibrio sp. TaxID=2035812 RepID=UPI003D0E2D91
MRLVIREYLQLLKESGELDELLPELLLKMGYVPTSKAQKGVRQGGVDVAVVGKDKSGSECLLLFVIKCGNITRSGWDSGENSVRQSLNEVRDVYLQTKVLPAHKGLHKKIILCTNGDLVQAVDPQWHGYVEKNTVEGELEFEFWGIDTLTKLVEKHLLDEAALSEENRSDFRKALALIGEPEYDLTHYYRLLQKTLFYDNTGLSEARDFKEFKLAILTCNLLLNIMFYWAQSEDNLRHVLPASERTMLLGWELVRSKRYAENRKAMEVYANLVGTYAKISAAYYQKMQGHYHTRDALSLHASEHILISESVFEQIGIVALIGLFHINNENIQTISEGLVNIINNNPSSSAPCYDRHSIEINLALLLLFYTGRIQDAKNWLGNLCGSFLFCIQRGRYFPIGNDSFDDAVKLSTTNWHGPLVDEAKSISTLLAIYAQWCCIFGLKDKYDLMRKCQQELPNTAVQLWFPDKDTEDKIFTGHAQETGTTLVPIILPETMDEFKQEVRELDDVDFILKHHDFDTAKHGYWAILLTASRHYKTPIIPSIWQDFMNIDVDSLGIKVIKPKADQD